jgi:hypothetical protein
MKRKGRKSDESRGTDIELGRKSLEVCCGVRRGRIGNYFGRENIGKSMGNIEVVARKHSADFRVLKPQKH